MKKKHKKTINLDKEVKNTGIALIVLGVLHFILSGFLDFDWGIVLIIVGIISLFYRSRKMLLTFGILLVLVGILNLTSGILDSMENISAGWAIFGVFQIIWGIQEINRFRMIKENPKYNIKGKKAFLWYGLRISFWIMVVGFILNFIINEESAIYLIFAEFFIISVIFTFIVSIIHFKKHKQQTFAVISLLISLLLILMGILNMVLPEDLYLNDIDYSVSEYKGECEEVIPERFNVFCKEVGLTTCYTLKKIDEGNYIFTRWADNSKVTESLSCTIGNSNGENVNYLYCNDENSYYRKGYLYYNKSYDDEGFITEKRYEISLILDYTDHTDEGYRVVSYDCI